MSTFTINIKREGTEQFLLKILEMLSYNPGIKMRKEGDQYFIEKAEIEDTNTLGSETQALIESLLDEFRESNDNPALPGKPMTWDQLKARIDKSERDYENGFFKTTEQMRNESNKW